MKLKHILLAFSLFGLVSCSNFLDEKMHNRVDEKKFFKTMEDCDLAVTGCYSYLGTKQIQDANWYASFQVPSLMCDEMVWHSNAPMRQISYADMSEREPGVYNIWKGSYQAINWANRAIAGFQTSPAFGENQELRDEYIAHAKLIRSLFYFNMVRFFGDIPLILEPESETAEVMVSRTPALLVYKQIIEDLEFAKTHLKTRTQVQKVGHGTTGAAAALLAKVYAQMSGRPLYLNCWDKCKAEIEYVMGMNGSPCTGDDGYSLYNSYFNLFHPDHENNCEIILDVQYAEGEVYGSNLGTYYSGVGGKVQFGGRGGGFTAFVLKDHWQNMYKKNKAGVRDPRYDRNIGDMNMPNNSNVLNTPSTVIMNKKFARLDTPTTGILNSWQVGGNPTNVNILRMADMYLLYAEAINELNHGPNDVAYEYVNKVRRRAWGLEDFNAPAPETDLEPGMDYATFHQAIMDERSVELCFEGHRWFDLVRWNKLVEVVRNTDQPAALTIAEKHYFFPIPEEEIIMNPNLTQNPGWAGGPAL